jgi:hypothetical protein
VFTAPPPEFDPAYPVVAARPVTGVVIAAFAPSQDFRENSGSRTRI